MIRIKKRYIFLGISFALLAAVVWYANPSVLIKTILKSDIRFILLAVAVSTFSLFLRVLKWKVLLNSTGFRELFPVQVLGMTISNFTPGKVAEPLKAMLLKMKKGTNISETLPSIIWERIIDVAVILVLSVFALHYITGRFLILGLVSVLIFISVIVVFVAVLKSRKVGMRIFSFARKFPLMNKITESFVDTFYSSRIKKRRLLLCFFITLAAWFLDSITMYLSFTSLGISTDVFTLAGIIALSTIIGIASSLPGGIGSSEAVMVFMLGAMAIPGATAMAGVLIFRFAGFWYGAFVGLLSFIYLSRKIDMKSIKV